MNERFRGLFNTILLVMNRNHHGYLHCFLSKKSRLMKKEEKIVWRPMVRKVMAKIDSLILSSAPKCAENHSAIIAIIMPKPIKKTIPPNNKPFSRLKRR